MKQEIERKDKQIAFLKNFCRDQKEKLKTLEEQNGILKNNLLILLKTARTEIERKDRQIEEFRREE